MTTYAARFTAALAAALPDGFTVSDLGHGLIIASHGDGSAQLSGHLPDGDKRRAVLVVDVERWIKIATGRVRLHMAHYTPQAAQDATAMLAALSAPAASAADELQAMHDAVRQDLAPLTQHQRTTYEIERRTHTHAEALAIAQAGAR